VVPGGLQQALDLALGEGGGQFVVGDGHPQPAGGVGVDAVEAHEIPEEGFEGGALAVQGAAPGSLFLLLGQEVDEVVGVDEVFQPAFLLQEVEELPDACTGTGVGGVAPDGAFGLPFDSPSTGSG